MNAIDQSKRDVNRELHVGQQRPGIFVVRLDGRRLFCQRELHTNQAIHMTVGDVMNNLPHRPAFGPIRRVELSVSEIGNCGAHAIRQPGDGIDRGGA